MTNYFVWERDFANRWNPVCYHQSKPPKTVNGSEMDRSPYYEIPADLIQDGEALFGKLMQKFPAPNN